MNTTFLKATLIIAVLFTAVMLYAQSNLLTVTGKVIDAETKEELPGVNILEKGTTNGAITDVNGNFSIKVSSGKTLVFAYIGYITKEVKVTTATIHVSLQPDTSALEEIAIVGYGTQRKSQETRSKSQSEVLIIVEGQNSIPPPSMRQEVQA